MGVFNELKTIPGVEKIVKFKQSILMEAATKAGLITKEHFAIVQGGACEAYALAWIKEKLYPPQERMFHRAKGIKSKVDVKSIQTAANLVQPYLEYVEDREQLDWAQASYGLADKQGLDIADESDAPHENIVEVVDYCKSKLKPGEAVRIVLDIEGLDSTHAVALFRAADTFLHFFDPNIGEYRIRPGEVSTFLAKYEAALKRGDPPFVITGCATDRVKRNK